MALRYLAIVSTPPAPRQTSLATLAKRTGFDLIFECPELGVLTNGQPGDTILSSGSGVLIGHAFSREFPAKRIFALTANQFQAIGKSKAEAWLKAVWGGYVSFSLQDGEVHILRDPSGAMPCYYLKVGTDLFVASDIECLVATGLIKPAIDWHALTQHLLAYDLRSTRTCLTGLTELLPGFRLTCGNGDKLTQCWSPWDYTDTSSEVPFTYQIQMLRQIIETCVSAWGESYEKILLGVSGGLDSSVLAAILSKRRSSLQCLNLATDEAVGDERRYARALARSLDLPLTERFHEIDSVDPLISTASHLPRPILFALAQSEHRIRESIVVQSNIDAVFTGIGGDNVFCYMSSATPALDRLKSEGLSAGVWSTLNDICALTGASLTQALGNLLQRGLRATPRYRWRPDTAFLASPQSARSSFLPQHPWLMAPDSALPGKAVHIALLIRVQSTFDGFSRTETPQINPFLSQPIMEVCLRIPTWQWCHGGRDRALIRDGFSDALPQMVLDRRSKGGPTAFAYEIVETHKAALRTQLLEGLLVSQGLLDRKALEAALSLDHSIKPTDHMRLLMLAEAEAWVRYWS